MVAENSRTLGNFEGVHILLMCLKKHLNRDITELDDFQYLSSILVGHF